MKKTTASINFGYQFNPKRKGAKYSLDGEHWMNAGDFAEIADKMVKGLGNKKDANTAYNIDSDIPETHTSVKSSKATLVSKVIGTSFETVKANYFATVASTNWDWVVIVDDMVNIYNMDAKEFSEFMDTWGTWCEDRKTIRFKSSSTKMLSWLEARV